MKNKYDKLVYWSQVIVIGVVLGFGIQAVNAWTEPTAGPPGNNLGAPINTSNLGQTKMGSLSSNTSFNINAWDSQYLADDKRSFGGARGWGVDVLFINGFADWINGVQVGSWAHPSGLQVHGDIDTESGGKYGAGGIRFDYHSISSRDNGWLYVGDQNYNVFGGRGLAAGQLWAGDGLYTAYAKGCSKLYTDSSGKVLCGVDQTGGGAMMESDTLQTVMNRGNSTDKPINLTGNEAQIHVEGKRAIGGSKAMAPFRLYINGFGDWGQGVSLGSPSYRSDDFRVYSAVRVYGANPNATTFQVMNGHSTFDESVTIREDLSVGNVANCNQLGTDSSGKLVCKD